MTHRKEMESPRREKEPKSPRGKEEPASPRRDQEQPSPRNHMTKEEQMAAKSGFMSGRADSPFPSLSSHSRVHHADAEKRHDFIRGDYRSAKSDTDAPPLSRLQHLDLSHSAGSLRNGNENKSASEPTSSTLRNLLQRSNNKAISQSSPELPSFTPSNSTAHPLAQTQAVPPPTTWEEPHKPRSESPPRIHVTFDTNTVIHESDLRPSTPAFTTTPRRPPSPILSAPPDVHAVAPHLSKKNIAQQIQSLLPSPPSRPSSSSLAHSVSTPSIASPESEGEFVADLPFKSPKSSFIGEGRKLSSNSANQYQSLRSPPSRPDTPSPVLSFERATSHESLKSTSPIPQIPSTYPSLEAPSESEESLKMVENVKLVCVECRKQIANKDVVVAFMHHYYHWACVRCYKCHQYVLFLLSQDVFHLFFLT